MASKLAQNASRPPSKDGVRFAYLKTWNFTSMISEICFSKLFSLIVFFDFSRIRLNAKVNISDPNLAVAPSAYKTKNGSAKSLSGPLERATAMVVRVACELYLRPCLPHAVSISLQFRAVHIASVRLGTCLLSAGWTGGSRIRCSAGERRVLCTASGTLFRGGDSCVHNPHHVVRGFSKLSKARSDLVSACTLQSRRPYQEDRYLVSHKTEGLSLYACFDGHGGDDAADYAKKHIIEFLDKHLQESANLETALRATFREVSQPACAPA